MVFPTSWPGLSPRFTSPLPSETWSVPARSQAQITASMVWNTSTRTRACVSHASRSGFTAAQSAVSSARHRVHRSGVALPRASTRRAVAETLPAAARAAVIRAVSSPRSSSCTRSRTRPGGPTRCSQGGLQATTSPVPESNAIGMGVPFSSVVHEIEASLLSIASLQEGQRWRARRAPRPLAMGVEPSSGHRRDTRCEQVGDCREDLGSGTVEH